MRTGIRYSAFGSPAEDSRCEAVLLGRLGSEIATVYQDTLDAPLPAGLRVLIERLELALGRTGQDRQLRATDTSG